MSEKELRNSLWRYAPARSIGIGIPERLGQERIRLLVVPLELKAPQTEGSLLDHVDFLLLRRPPEEFTRIRLVDQPPFRPLGKNELTSLSLLWKKNVASFVTCRGRRRIGKSSLSKSIRDDDKADRTPVFAEVG